MHGDRRNRGKKLRRLAAREGEDAVEQLGAPAPPPDGPPLDRRPTDHYRLAVCLKASDDLHEAAELAGLAGYSATELEALRAKAEGETGLVELDAGAIGQQLRRGIALLAVDFLDRNRSGRLPAGQLGTTIKALAQGIELMQGGTGKSYQPIHLEVVGPEGTIYDATGDPEIDG